MSEHEDYNVDFSDPDARAWAEGRDEIEPKVGDIVRVSGQDREVLEIVEPRPGWRRALTRCPDRFTQYVDVEHCEIVGLAADRMPAVQREILDMISEEVE